MAFAHSRCTSCAAPRCPPRISCGDSFGTQCRYKPSPNISIIYSGNTIQKVELFVNSQLNKITAVLADVEHSAGENQVLTLNS